MDNRKKIRKRTLLERIAKQCNLPPETVEKHFKRSSFNWLVEMRVRIAEEEERKDGVTTMKPVQLNMRQTSLSSLRFLYPVDQYDPKVQYFVAKLRQFEELSMNLPKLIYVNQDNIIIDGNRYAKSLHIFYDSDIRVPTISLFCPDQTQINLIRSFLNFSGMDCLNAMRWDFEERLLQQLNVTFKIS